MLQEEVALWFAVAKWTLLAVLSGIMVGAGVTVFVKLLEYSLGVTSELSGFWVYAVLPLGLIASTLSVH